MFNTHDISRNACQLFGRQADCGYDWWWHSLTARHAESGEERAFFIEFFTCNRNYADSPQAIATPIEPLLLKRPQAVPSYVMVKAGCWGEGSLQLHRFFRWSEAEVAMTVPFSVKAGDCMLEETHTEGHVIVTPEESVMHPEWMCDAGEMSWKLDIRKEVAFNVGYGASALMRRLQAFEMFWHAEGMRTSYEGEIILNGERYVVRPENCYGYADKNWGRDFTSPWLWLSSCCLTSELTGSELKESVFDIGGGRPVVLGVRLPGQLLSAFWYEGRPFEFNFSKFWTGTRTSFYSEETDTEIIWHVDQRNWTDRMVTDIRCSKAEMLLVNYEAPDGVRRHRRLWNGGTGHGTVCLYRHGKLLDRITATHVGCEYGEYGL